MYHSIGSGSQASQAAFLTIGVAKANPHASAAKVQRRARRSDSRPQIQAAAAIDGPMMFRMSALKMPFTVAPGLRAQDWRRNRKASPKICQPRFWTDQAAAARSPDRRVRDEAAIVTDTPARKRNMGAARPPMKFTAL